MTRYIEILRRKFVRIQYRFFTYVFAIAVILLSFYAMDTYMRFIDIQTSENESASIWAPLVKGDAGYALQLAGVSVQEKDVLTVSDGGDGTAHVHIERAFPVSVTADGVTTEHMTIKGGTKDTLTALGYTVNEHDYAEPSLDQAITGETQNITLYRVEYTDYEVNEVLEFETQYQYTSLLAHIPKTQILIQEGADGFFNGIMRDKLVDGVVVETTQVEVVQSTEPVAEIIKVYGEGVPISPLEAPDGITVTDHVPSSYSTVYEMKATGYYSATGKGSSGLGLYYGTFAVDPTLIPYGTKVYIVSTDGDFIYGWAIATDTGAFIHSTRMQVDLFYETYAESAANWVQQVYVYIP